MTEKEIESVCAYCGCGCKLKYVVEGGKLVKMAGSESDDVSEGKPCIKGLTLHEVFGSSEGRILKPMLRRTKDAELEEVSWEDALEFIGERTNGLEADEVFFNLSGKVTNEDNYAIRKLAERKFKTKNIDSCCSRLCHVTSVRAMQRSFGIGANPWKMDDVYNTDCLFVIGSNPASNYPVLFNKILKAKKEKGLKLISVQPMLNETSKSADLALRINTWSEAVLLGAMINNLIETKNYSIECERMEGFPNVRKSVSKVSAKNAIESCGITAKKFAVLMNLVKSAKNLGVIHGMGITQDENAMPNLYNLLNMVMLKNGRLLSARGELNVQGAGDVCIVEKGGKDIVEALLLRPVKAAFVCGFNPAQSMPNLDEVHRNLRKMFVVQMESYSNLTTEFADVVLPTPTIAERVGTITNGERRVRLVRKVMEPMGESKPEWMIMNELGDLGFKNERQILSEIVKDVEAYKKINVDKIYSGKDGWADKKIKFRRFNSRSLEPVADIRTEKYPFILITFRSLHHFLTGELTSKSETLQKSKDGAYIYISADDAEKIKVKDGDKVKVTSVASSLDAEVKIDEKFSAGVVGAHFHFRELLVNKLFPNKFEKETHTPNYKSVAVSIEKL